jgi:hypothetical protein
MQIRPLPSKVGTYGVTRDGMTLPSRIERDVGRTDPIGECLAVHLGGDDEVESSRNCVAEPRRPSVRTFDDAWIGAMAAQIYSDDDVNLRMYGLQPQCAPISGGQFAMTVDEQNEHTIRERFRVLDQ